ncbi:hypothetical protein BY458DRAFT_517592 [Sporodiniella umbellata]|nr:hypothetical protein BY458DRAFT_517592 [Sporodiniella umbellata]
MAFSPYGCLFGDLKEAIFIILFIFFIFSFFSTMNQLIHHFLQNYNSSHPPPNGPSLGSGPMDWLLNAAAFTGADGFLNKIDDEEGKHPHTWRNAGMAGALALAYQWYRNHQERQYYQPSYYPSPYPPQYYPSPYYPTPYYPTQYYPTHYDYPYPQRPRLYPPPYYRPF